MAMFLASACAFLSAGAKMDCSKDVAVCGVLTLETGLGPGVYKHPFPSVHGLWPETGEYGNSQCVAPSGSSDCCSKIYSCYAKDNGGNKTSIIEFEEHEWGKHGKCAGVKDGDDFFGQICALSTKPLSLMTGKSSLQAVQAALKEANIEIFDTDESNAQVSLSACLNSDSGKWFLAAVADFPRVCGSSNPPPPHPHPSPSPSPPTGRCVPDKHGPPCQDDSDCTKYQGCVRCARSKFCTHEPKHGYGNTSAMVSEM